MYQRSGLGAVWSSDGTSFTFPGWCDYVPFSDYSADCQPPSEKQLAAMQKAQLAKVAAVNPAAAAAAMLTGDDLSKAYCALYPEDCAAYTNAPKEGASVFEVLLGPNFSLLNPASFPAWLWVALAGVGVLLIGGKR